MLAPVFRHIHNVMFKVYGERVCMYVYGPPDASTRVYDFFFGWVTLGVLTMYLCHPQRCAQHVLCVVIFAVCVWFE